jgi:hypothetical protein
MIILLVEFEKYKDEDLQIITIRGCCLLLFFNLTVHCLICSKTLLKTKASLDKVNRDVVIVHAGQPVWQPYFGPAADLAPSSGYITY